MTLQGQEAPGRHEDAFFTPDAALLAHAPRLQHCSAPACPAPPSRARSLCMQPLTTSRPSIVQLLLQGVWATELLIQPCRLQTADLAMPPAQTNIVTDGFRSLAEGEQVEFVVDQSDDGRPKAIEVTGPGGANPQVGGRSPALPV